MRVQLNPKLVVSMIYVTAMFMAALDGTIVNVALPAIANELQILPSATGGINIGYLVSIAVVLPIAGWLGDRFGTKRIFLMALGLFTVASALCGFATHLQALNWFRVIQGVGGGLLTPIGMAMLFRTFSPEERPKVSRSLVVPIAVAPAVGPIIGGLLVEQLSWRWVFFINLPLGIWALFIGFLFLDEHKEPVAGRLDLPGLLLSAPGFSMLMYALIQGSAKGWGSPDILSLGGCGLILLSALVWVELRVTQPMLDFRLLSDRLFRKMSIISFFAAAGLVGMLFIFPLMYQNALNASALDSGLITFPEAIGLMLASRIMPWSYRRLGARQVISIGLGGAIILFLLLGTVGPETNPWFIRILFFDVGFFLGHAVVAVQFLTFNNITSASMARATTLFNVQNRMGSTLGILLPAGLLRAFDIGAVDPTRLEQPLLIGYQLALAGSAVFLVVGLFLGLWIRNADLGTAAPKQAGVRVSDSISMGKGSE